MYKKKICYQHIGTIHQVPEVNSTPIMVTVQPQKHWIHIGLVPPNRPIMVPVTVVAKLTVSKLGVKRNQYLFPLCGPRSGTREIVEARAMAMDRKQITG